MIFLFVLYNIFLHGNVLAAPFPPLQPTTETRFYLHETNPNKFTQRSEWNITWGCFATLFACSWVAIHLNIPPRSHSSTQIFFRRLIMMAYMLIFPEMVILHAGKEWLAACFIAIAQWLEHLVYVWRVLGSIPSLAISSV